MANTSAIWPQSAWTTYQLSSRSCSRRHGDKNRREKKQQTLNEKCWRLFWKKSGKWTISRKMTRQKSKTNRKTREDRKGESNDSPEIQDMGEHQTSWPPFMGQTGKNIRYPQPPFSSQKDHQTSWPPFMGQTEKNIRHPGLPSGARQGRTSDILASLQGPHREEHQIYWPPFRGHTGKNIRHPGLLSENNISSQNCVQVAKYLTERLALHQQGYLISIPA